MTVHGQLPEQRMGGAAASRERLDAATRLAFERTRVAYERTLMAWVRTATSLITFGFAVYKFFQFELGRHAPAAAMLIGPRGFGLTLIVIGLMSVLLGVAEHGRDLRTLRRDYAEMPPWVSKAIGLVIAALGIVALVAVVVRA